MKICVVLGILLAAVGAQAYEGPMFPATVWRGETAYVRIPPKFVGEIGCVLAAELKDFNEKYSFGKALKGAFDFGECRREIDAHVNR